jgi:hypothetical protein
MVYSSILQINVLNVIILYYCFEIILVESVLNTRNIY